MLELRASSGELILQLLLSSPLLEVLELRASSVNLIGASSIDLIGSSSEDLIRTSSVEVATSYDEVISSSCTTPSTTLHNPTHDV